MEETLLEAEKRLGGGKRIFRVSYKRAGAQVVVV